MDATCGRAGIVRKTAMDIRNRKAIVLGGTSGIGLATARKLASGGAEVVAASRNPGKAGEVPIRLRACDARDAGALADLFAEEAPFDILVNAATGGERAIGPFLEMDMDGFKASFDKLWSYANTVRYGTPHMSPEGTIVLVSGSPARKPRAGQIALSSVGAAVEAFARAAAREIRPRRINVVSPGIIDTPMISASGEARTEIYRKMTSGNVIPRPGKPEEVADAILFVIANEFVTGTTVDVDGGWLIS